MSFIITWEKQINPILEIKDNYLVRYCIVTVRDVDNFFFVRNLVTGALMQI